MYGDLADGVLKGEPRAIARAITLVESGQGEARGLLTKLRASAGRARVVGVTGSPGTGKSTLIHQLVKEFRARGRTVGVVSVDPSSPFTGGAILGDRVRMQELARDPGVFIRSMATRGCLGGLADATEGAVTILDAAGKDLVLVETAGVGQNEVEIAWAAQTTVLVVAPGMGDDIQALKSGILEIADIFVVNKADLDGADRAALALEFCSVSGPRGWRRPILKTASLSALGIRELADAVDAHGAHRSKLDAGAKKRVVRKRLLAVAGRRLLERLESLADSVELDALVERVAAREVDLPSAAEELVEALGIHEHSGRTSPPSSRGLP